jgi:eukaryotic-like serine/threonine-protein kinase
VTTSQAGEEALFNAARHIGDAVARAQYLRDGAGGDDALLRRVEALLAVYDTPDRLLDQPAVAAVPTEALTPKRRDEPAAVVPTESAGSQIGPYKLLEQIGEGGMGTVFMAEQTHPVQRKVALKVIKPGMDSRQVIARFEAERQALAIMDHVNIARVFDAGATESGRPYFVMEFVHGVPITKYCDDNHLTPRQRLELFVPVCQAIQHAHQKGIIHRDLKPSNVMITLYDGKPVAKVIDFGVAKATEQKLTERTLFTQYGTLVGTLEYMSPEQAEMSALGVDTRSDIFSLGVLLYELLTGNTPLSHKRVREAAYAEILRMIKEEEPPRPSTRLSDSGEALASISAQRHMEPAKLKKLVRGELDWIVMKALEKDRDRRYETANGLARDIERYLADEPVQACPPSPSYRLRKFARRNKGAMVTATVIALAVPLAVGSLMVGYLRSERSLRREKRATDELVQTLYYQWVARADHERTKNRPALAEELLDQCPANLRGWEWHYVKRLPFAAVPKLLHDDANPINCVAWSPDQRLLASGCLSGWVKVWDARTGVEVSSFKAQKKFVRSLAFSPDSRILATGGEDDTVKLWDLTRPDLPIRESIREFRTGPATTMQQVLEFSPDGRQLATADSGRKVRLWNVADGTEVFFPDHLVIAGGLAFTPDSRQLITVNTDNVVTVWDATTRRAIAAFHADNRAVGYRAAFSRDRRLLAIGCEDGMVRLIRTEPLEEVQTIEAHAGEVAGVAFGSGDERMVTAGEDLTVKIWDLRTRKQALALDIVQRRANGLAFSPDGHRLAVGSGEGVVQILDGTPITGAGDAGGVFTLEGHGHAVVGLAYSPDGQRLVSASRDGTAKIWDAGTGRELITFRGHTAPLSRVAWTPDGRWVASASWDGTVRVWDQTTGIEVVPALDARVGPVYGLALVANGSALATGHHDGSVRVWEVATGELKVLIPRAHTVPVLGVAFGSSDQLATAGGTDNTIKIWQWQADTEKPIQSLVAKQSIIRNPTFSLDGKHIAAVVATPARVWMWDWTTREQTTPLLPQAWKVSQTIFRPGGRLVVVSGGRIDFLARDLSDGPALIGCHAGEICCAAFSPSGRRMATGAGYNGRGVVRIWDASQWEKTL